MWVFFGLFSALFLGLYDAIRKKVLGSNPVIPVLFLASFTGAVIFLPFILLSRIGLINSGFMLYIPKGSFDEHLLALYKSILVGSSWFLAYNALSQLPLTIVIPIRSTGPMWTLIAALIIFDERFTPVQWIGIITVMGFFYYFTLAGRKEGINFFRNRWIFAAIGATLLGGASSLYDKYLFSHYDRLFIQAWYSVYMVPVLFPVLMLAWFPRRKTLTKFSWNFSIHLIGIILVVSDFLYFYALSNEGALIGVLSILRRSSVVISFMAGAVFFGERNLKRKGLALAGILLGIALIILGTIG
jgi:transporter family protein